MLTWSPARADLDCGFFLELPIPNFPPFPPLPPLPPYRIISNHSTVYFRKWSLIKLIFWAAALRLASRVDGSLTLKWRVVMWWVVSRLVTYHLGLGNLLNLNWLVEWLCVIFSMWCKLSKFHILLNLVSNCLKSDNGNYWVIVINSTRQHSSWAQLRS